MAQARTRRGGLLRRIYGYLDARFRIKWRVVAVGAAILRALRPIVVLRGSAYVLRDADVRDAMERPDDFSVSIFDMRMSETIGSYFLGMDPSPRYSRESDALFGALRVPDPRVETQPGSGGDFSQGSLPWIAGYAEKHSRQLVEAALKTKEEVDVVEELAHVVPYRFACEFFGVRERPELLRWFQLASYYVFAPSAEKWAVAARRAGRLIAAHIQAELDERRTHIEAGVATPDDVLDRMLRAQGGDGGVDDDTIVRSLTGTMSGTMIPTAWLFIEAVDRLMRLPKYHLEGLQQLARVGDRSAVRKYVLEAARFFPFPGIILRYAERDTMLSGRPIPQGTHVNLVILSASRDGRAVQDSGRFSVDRPESEYMLFGHDVHSCHGKDIAEVILTEMAMALFSRENLRRAPGRRGYIENGPKGVLPESSYPQHLVLRADG